MTQLTDQMLSGNWTELEALVLRENYRQIAKHGIQTRTPFEWMTYLSEETGELAQAITENEYRGADARKVVDEAIQTATLALKIAEMYL